MNDSVENNIRYYIPSYSLALSSASSDRTRHYEVHYTYHLALRWLTSGIARFKSYMESEASAPDPHPFRGSSHILKEYSQTAC
jgi:hypothetical protein